MRGARRGVGRGSRDVNSLSSRRESRKRAERIGGLKRDRIRNPGGKVARDTGDRGEELERPAEGEGLKPGAGRETLDLSGFAVALRVAKSADTCALPALRPTSASLSLQHPVRGHWGRGPTAGLTRTSRAAETPLLNELGKHTSSFRPAGGPQSPSKTWGSAVRPLDGNVYFPPFSLWFRDTFPLYCSLVPRTSGAHPSKNGCCLGRLNP